MTLKGLQQFLNIVLRAFFHLYIYLPDVFSDDSEADQRAAADKPDGDHERRPAGHDIVLCVGGEDIDKDGKRHDDHCDAEGNDQTQRLDAERGDTVDGEVQHLTERILAFASQPGTAVVIDGVGAVAHQWHDAAKEQVALLVAAQLLDSPLFTPSALISL